MKETLSDIRRWLDEGKRFALATVVDTWRSAPRMIGSVMLISSDMEVIGSVSGGCVEGSVIKQAKETLETGEAKLLRFGVSNDEAWSVGLSCGGKIKVFVEPFMGLKPSENSQAIWQKVSAHLSSAAPFVLIHQIDEEADKYLFNPGQSDLAASKAFLAQRAQTALVNRASELITVDESSYFLQVFPPQNHLVIVGAAHLSVDLVSLAQQLDFQTTVIDPRGIFADSLRAISDPDALIKAWPADVLPTMDLDENVFAVTLTHDPKIDDQALQIFLKQNVRYIGALGSRKTHQRRLSRLAKAGFSEVELDKINGPIGLSIHARSAREIALSIVSQLVEYRNQPIQTTNHA